MNLQLLKFFRGIFIVHASSASPTFSLIGSVDGHLTNGGDRTQHIATRGSRIPELKIVWIRHRLTDGVL